MKTISPSQPVVYVPGHHKRPPHELSWVILSDFDGTISRQDVTDTLIDAFGNERCRELESRWEAGEIGSRECMAGQIAELRASPAELDACIDSISLDPDFADFVGDAKTRGLEVRILSDGLDRAIHRLLHQHDLAHLQVTANKLSYRGQGRWHLDFPYADPDCRKRSGHCKCMQLERCQQAGEHVLYIGDGSSDFCVSGEADMIFAKDKLLSYCQQHHLYHHAIHGFAAARALLDQALSLHRERRA